MVTRKGSNDLAAGAFLRQMRRSTGMSPEQLRDTLGVGATTIRSAEEGRIPHDRTQYVLARYFGKEPTDIWTVARMNRRKKARRVR